MELLDDLSTAGTCVRGVTYDCLGATTLRVSGNCQGDFVCNGQRIQCGASGEAPADCSCGSAENAPAAPAYKPMHRVVCDLPAVAAGRYHVRVEVPGKGYAAHPAANVDEYTFTSELSFDAIEPKRGSWSGGILVTVTGAGFSSRPSNNTVLIEQGNETKAAHVLDACPTRLFFVMPSFEHEVNKTWFTRASAQNDTEVGTASMSLSTKVVIAVDTDLVPHHEFGQMRPSRHRYAQNVEIDGVLLAELEVLFSETRSAEYENISGAWYEGSWKRQTTFLTSSDECTALSGPAGCEFVYEDDLTPLLTGVVPPSGFKGDSITLSGENFQRGGESDTADFEVKIGNVLCAVTSRSATEIVCTLGASPAGVHDIYVTNAALGTARAYAEVEFESLFEATGLSRDTGSHGGGHVVTITGRGFGSDESIHSESQYEHGSCSARRRRDGAWGGWVIYDYATDDAELVNYGSVVVLGGKNCTILSSNYTTVVCETPAIDTSESLLLPTTNEAGVVTGTVVSSEKTAKVITSDCGKNGRWRGIFRQTGATFVASQADWLYMNAGYPNHAQYSILGDLESFRGTDGRFELKIEYPQKAGRNYNVWRQSSNPVTASSLGVDGYEAVDVNLKTQGWGGLEKNTGGWSLLDGSVNSGNWWYAIGTTRPWSPQGFPGSSVARSLVELSVCEERPATEAGAFDRLSADPVTLESAFEQPFYASNASGCFTGLDFGEHGASVITKVRWFPMHQKRDLVIGGVFDGGVCPDGEECTMLDDVVWTELATITESFEGWQFMPKDNSTLDEERDRDANQPLPRDAFRFVRYRGPEGSHCEIAEIEFFGHRVSPTPDLDFTIQTQRPLSHPSLGPTRTNLDTTASYATGLTYHYSTASTPVVTGVEPPYGTALGGQLVTITGQGFPSSAANAEVVVNERPCLVVESSPTQVVCQTSKRTGFRPLSVKVRGTAEATAVGFGVHDVTTTYRYLDKWSELTTWLNEEPPIEGDSVVVPNDQAIVVDIPLPRLFLVIVQGFLMFDPNAKEDLNMNATYIVVYGGTLQAGTTAEPFENNLAITLHGHRYETIQLPTFGSKVLAVADRGGLGNSVFANGAGYDVPLSQRGVIDIHGSKRIKTWVDVAAKASAGTNVIYTSTPVDFKQNDSIVISGHINTFTGGGVSNALKTKEIPPCIYPPVAKATSEELVVDYIEQFDNCEVYAYDHGEEHGCGNPRPSCKGTKIVLKSVMQYDHLSEVTTTPECTTIDLRSQVALLTRNVKIQGDDTSQQSLFGSHTIAVHGGHLRVENTEVRNCGQAAILGRYCLHFHKAGYQPPPNSFFRHNSIHHSFQRATTIHSTSHALVQGNVAYHVMGHNYFVEDGDEEFVVLDGNLGIETMLSPYSLKSDCAASTFWTATPKNIWRNNVAANSLGNGFWFELDAGAAGDFTHHPTIEVRNNRFHDSNMRGWFVVPTYKPTTPQYFHDNTYARNGMDGVMYGKGGDTHHIRDIFASNSGNGDLLWWFFPSKRSSYWIPNLKDVTFEGGHRALNAVGARNLPAPTTGLFGPNMENFLVDGVEFVDYGDVSTISQCFDCCGYRARQAAYTTRFNNLRFYGCDRRASFVCPAKQIYYDLDGSLSGTGDAHSTVTAYHAFNEWEECPRQGKLFSGGLICNSSVRVRKAQIPYESGVPNKVQPSVLADRDLLIKKSRMINPFGFTVIIQTGRQTNYKGAVPHFMKKHILQNISDLVGLKERHVQEVDVPPEYLINGSASSASASGVPNTTTTTTTTDGPTTDNPDGSNDGGAAGNEGGTTICGEAGLDDGPQMNMAVMIGGYRNDSSAWGSEALYKAYNLMCKGAAYTDPQYRHISLYWQKLGKLIDPAVDIICTEPAELVHTCEQGWNMNSPHYTAPKLFHSQSSTGAAPVVDKGASGCTPSQRCDVCEGDCDSDSDCATGLKCHQRRTSTATVLGCAGTGYVKTASDHDYCYDPDADATTSSRAGTVCDSTDMENLISEVDRFYKSGARVCKTFFPAPNKASTSFCKDQETLGRRRRHRRDVLAEDSEGAQSTWLDMYQCSLKFQDEYHVRGEVCQEYYSTVATYTDCEQACLAREDCTSFTHRTKPGAGDAACILYNEDVANVIGAAIVPGSFRTQGQKVLKDPKLSCLEATAATGGTTCVAVPADSACYVKAQAQVTPAAAEFPSSTDTCQSPVPLVDEFGGVNWEMYGSVGELYNNKDGYDKLQYGPGKHQDDSFDWFGWTIPCVAPPPNTHTRVHTFSSARARFWPARASLSP